MSDLDRIGTNFRLSLISQREQNSLLKEVASALRVLADKVDTAAGKGDETAERLEQSIQVMQSFADGQREIRQTLAEYGRRLDDLEGKQAS